MFIFSPTYCFFASSNFWMSFLKPLFLKPWQWAAGAPIVITSYVCSEEEPEVNSLFLLTELKKLKYDRVFLCLTEAQLILHPHPLNM